MMETAKTQNQPKRDLSQLKAVSNNLSIRDYNENSKCTLPVIPIYPARYGLSLNYLKKVRGEGNQKSEISEISLPSGMYPKGEHQLMQLRQGYVYIYAHTRHRLFSTDQAGKWLVFRHITHKNDSNSSDEFDLPEGGAEEMAPDFRFLLYKWGEEGANGKWEKAELNEEECPSITNVSVFDTIWVDKDAEMIDIAYSERPWSAEMFSALEQDVVLRSKIMTTVNVKVQSVTEHSGPLNEIERFMEEYSTQSSLNLSELSKDWHTIIANQPKLPQSSIMPSYAEKGLVVALEDVVGEMRELQKVLVDLAQKQGKYNAEHLYPITIGNIIDPKVNYDIRGVPFPLKDDDRVIAQRGVEKALNPAFKELFKSLLEKPFELYEKPMEMLVKKILDLSTRESFRGVLELTLTIISDSKVAWTGKERTAYCFFKWLNDIIFAMTETPQGITYLEYLLDGSHKQENDNPALIWIQQSFHQVLDVVEPAVEKVTQASAELKARWQVAKRLYKALNEFMASGLNIFGQSAALYRGPTAMRIFKLFGVFDVYDDPAKTQKAFEDLQTRLLNDSKQQLSDLAKNERDANKKAERPNHNIDYSARHRTTFIRRMRNVIMAQQTAVVASMSQSRANFDFMFSRGFGGAVNFFAVFSGIISLNEDLTLNSKQIKTETGKWTMSPGMVRSAALMDVSVASMHLAHMGGIISDPTGFTLRHRTGSIWQAIKAQPLKFGYFTLSILAGALTAIVSWGGIEEANANNDKVSVWGYRFMFYGSIAGIVYIVTQLYISLNPVGWLIATITLIGGILVTLFGDSSLVSWVKNGFWGGLDNDYLYWGNSKRDEIQKQIERAQILANGELINLDQIFSELTASVSVIDAISVASNIDESLQYKQFIELKEYLLIQKGFEDEVYGYFIQFGLQITLIKKGRFQISCAEFWRTPPTLTNLKVTCDIPQSKDKVIENMELTPNRDVVFSLAENGIERDDIKIKVSFTDRERTEYSAEYTSTDYYMATTPYPIY